MWTLLRPIPARAVMPIYASTDGSTEDGSLMSSDQQGSDSSSLQTTSSSPSEFFNDIHQHGYHLSPEYARRYRDGDAHSALNPVHNVYSPLLPTTCSESNCHHLTVCFQHLTCYIFVSEVVLICKNITLPYTRKAYQNHAICRKMMTLN